MELCLEYGCTSVNKFGEELCGDNVVSIVDGEYTTLAFAVPRSGGYQYG